MKTVCVITATRAEYGLLRRTMDAIRSSEKLRLTVIATGAHLSPEYGHTVDAISADGFIVDESIECLVSARGAKSTALAMGLLGVRIGDAFERLKPDILLVLGDRYELLPICSAALVMGVPIAHMSGGDVTEGAFDDSIRNAVTMMADIHFPGTQESAGRIAAMRGSHSRIVVAGEPGIENYVHLAPYPRESLAAELGVPSGAKWALFTYHPETRGNPERDRSRVESLLKILAGREDIVTIATYANADPGGAEINTLLEDFARIYPGKIFVYSSLGQERYLRTMREAWCVVGNSSSGIVEAPYTRTPCVDIGARQRGRFKDRNVISCDAEAFGSALDRIDEVGFREGLSACGRHYGDGRTSSIVVEELERQAGL